MIRVPIQTFNRISNACGDDPSRPFSHGVLIEATPSGKVFAVASDGRILACERVGFVQHFPAMSVIIPRLLWDGGFKHMSGDLIIMPGVAYVEIKGMPVDFLQPINEQYANWRPLALPKPAPKKPTVPVSFSSRHLVKLASTTLHGGIIFPEYVGMNSSIVVNDPDNPDWFGLYMPVVDEAKKDYQSAILPGWFE